MSETDKAFLYMVNLIAHGAEFPDAHNLTLSRFKVDGDELIEMYDNDN